MKANQFYPVIMTDDVAATTEFYAANFGCVSKVVEI